MQVSFARFIAGLAIANHENKYYPSLKLNKLKKKTTFSFVSQLLQMIVRSFPQNYGNIQPNELNN